MKSFKKYILEDVKFRSGLIPVYMDDQSVMVSLMIPSDPKYGGPLPQIAKGEIEPNLTPKDNAIKEAEEELGYVHKPDYDVKLLWDDKSKRMTWFYVIVDDMKFKKPHYETKEVLWMDINEAQKKIRDWQRPIIYVLKRRLGL